MALTSKESKDLILKVNYYGPSLGGKTTNLQWLYQTVAQDQMTNKVVVDANPERTQLYELVPMSIGTILGYRTRVHVFSPPGQTALQKYRKVILKNVDGIIFVADSQPERMEENVESMRELANLLEEQGKDIAEIPMVIQYNKRDLPNAAPISELRAALNHYNAPEVEACAADGKGVMEAVTLVSKKIVSFFKT